MTLDNEVLSQMQMTDDHRAPKVVTFDDDTVSLQSTFFIEFEDFTMGKSHDLAIYAVELDIDAELYFHKPNDTHKFPVVDGAYKNFKLKLRDCEFAINKNLVKGNMEDDDEDFDFDDDD